MQVGSGFGLGKLELFSILKSMTKKELPVIGWGRRHGHQRYRCKACGLLFHWDNKAVSKANRFIWFRRWIMDRQVYRTLSKEMQFSE
jgi:transposase-like protein